ncbi:uncharacterized protein LOC114818713, partial [Antrostomus carolinensis]|uniref:uncharacterized protein LOC114818713 n=1 Tax=Antrostomus carolinensis TaxID=279965 RepID=UPI0010A99516
MLTILIISLVFAHNHLVSKDPRECKCHVENASELSGRVRSLNISLQAPGMVTTTGKLSRTKKVITLGCFSLQRPVQVNLLFLEKLQGDLRNQTAEKCALQSLKVVAIADRKPAVSHTWVLLTRRRKNFQRTFILREKVFLAGISNCAIRAELPKLKAFSKSSTVPPVHQENKTLEKGIPSSNDKDMLNIQITSIIIKAFIACVLLAFAISYIVFVICENSCP